MKIIVLVLAFTVNVNAFGNEAFGGPGLIPNWASAQKVSVGTSFSKEQKDKSSLVWYSAAGGILTETYYPSIDTPQIKDAQLLITDGKTFFIQEKDLDHKIEVLSPSLIKLINTDKKNRFKIEHIIFTSQDKSVLIDKLRITSNVEGLSFYHLVNSSLQGNSFRDNLNANPDHLEFYEGKTKVHVTSSKGYEKTSAGFVGFSDGFQDLKDNYKMDWNHKSATNGNVAGVGKLKLPLKKGVHDLYLTYSFDQSSSFINIEEELAAYENGWKQYFRDLKIPSVLKNRSEFSRDLYLRSLFVMRALEDKLKPGAMIASLSHPWGQEVKQEENVMHGGYHLIWPRDLFHVSVALLAAGDKHSAYRALRFLKNIQYKSGQWNYAERIIPKFGAFPQNVWTTGKEYWGGLQIDQVGYPVQLFFHLYKKSNTAQKRKLLKEFSPMLKASLDFIKYYGPWSAQERWEENFGISPSSFSVAATALILGDEIFPGEYYKKTAMAWLNKPGDNIHTWTFTNAGIYGNGEYYLRVSGCDSYIGTWNPNVDVDCHIANSGERVSQLSILDQGFLKLSLMGLVNPNDNRIKNSLNILNQHIRVKTPNGYGWYRYSFDAYGEEKRGRLWPLLSSEHGRYYIQLQKETGVSKTKEIEDVFKSYLGFSNNGQMLPEQVFEHNGEGTEAATPLAWSHAEYVKLIWSMEKNKNVTNLLK